MFLPQDVSRYRCLGFLTLQEGIYIPDVHSDHTGITCHSLDHFTNVAIAAITAQFCKDFEVCSVKHIDISAAAMAYCQAMSFSSQLHPQKFLLPLCLHMSLISVY